jgi:hypothetical protein
MSKLILNMEAAESIIKTTKLLQDKIKADSKAALNPKMFIQENTEKLVKTARKQLAENSVERQKIFLKDMQEQKTKLDNYIKRERTGQEQIHMIRSQRIERAKTAEEAAAIYRRNVDRLSESEREKHRWIYDDALEEAIAQVEPEAAFIGEQTIDQYRGDIEKHYREGIKIAFEIFKQAPEIDALVNEQIEALAAGEEPVNYPWAKVVNEILENARQNVRGPEPLPTFKINPYDTEGEAEAAEAEPAEAI